MGGYADFIKYKSSSEALKLGGPPRISLFEDLIFYHTKHSKHLQLTESPLSATIFAQKIMASEYMMTLHYYRQLLARLGTKLSSREGFDVFDSFERAWSDLSSFQRRLDIMHAVLERDMERMGMGAPEIAAPNPPYSDQQPWMDTRRDFKHIESELLRYRQKADRMLGFFDSLASITGTRQSLNEARSVGTLTQLGMIFLPLSLVAGLFSMSDNYLPGGGRFWIYFAVSVPSVLVTFGVAWLFTQGRMLMDRVSLMSGRLQHDARQDPVGERVQCEDKIIEIVQKGSCCEV